MLLPAGRELCAGLIVFSCVICSLGVGAATIGITVRVIDICNAAWEVLLALLTAAARGLYCAAVGNDGVGRIIFIISVRTPRVEAAQRLEALMG